MSGPTEIDALGPIREITKACDSYEGKADASEDATTALDALTAAHIAAESGSAGNLQRIRGGLRCRARGGAPLGYRNQFDGNSSESKLKDGAVDRYYGGQTSERSHGDGF